MVHHWKAVARQGAGKVTKTQEPVTVVFLGAGASCADGAPTQGELFRDYFLHYNNQPSDRVHHSWDRELATFFFVFFGIDVDDPEGVKNATFPTFEEVLGILEIAESQNESFRDWGTTHLVDAQQKPRIQHMHDVLILLIAEILDKKLRGKATQHPKLIKALHNAEWLRQTSFVSLNYDILIDNAILPAHDDWKLGLDYAIDFVNVGDEWWRPEEGNSVKLLKLHGSLNWLYCPTCRTIRITPKEKGICKLKWHANECLCTKCQSLAVPIIIPPTYLKALSNLYLRQIWDAAERVLSECDRLVFCGYSFPDADIHIRYLLKRVEVNRQSTPEIFIVNEHDGKNDAARETEQSRYLRFFGDKSKVHWTDMSFEQFCEKPVSIEDYQEQSTRGE